MTKETVPLPRAAPAWRQLARAGGRRAKLDALPSADLPTHDAARRFWSQRAWAEYAAVPAIGQVVLSLVREGAVLETLSAYLGIAADEVRHAQLSRDLADALGGYVDEVPDGLGYAPRGLADPSDVPLSVWVLANGCFSETVSLALIRARHAKTRQPVVRQVLGETLRDEAVHVRISWQLADALLPSLGPRDRQDLAAYGDELAEMLRRTFGTAGLPRAVRARERKLRAQTAEAGLGALDPDHDDAIIDAELRRIRERLKRLGV